MLAQQAISSPTRLPPSPASGPLPALPLQNAMGNSALLQLLQGRFQAPAPSAPVGGGDVSTQWAEEIGESDDEIVIGGSVGRDGKAVAHAPGSLAPHELFYGYLGVDDLSLKAKAGLVSVDDGALDLEAIGFDFQAGVWEDDAEHWGMGIVAEGGLAEVGLDVIGDHEGDGGYFRIGGELVSGGAAAYYGEDGAVCELKGTAMEGFAEVGTGANADRAWDTSLKLGGGFDAGIEAKSLFTDEDGDGIEEMNLAFGIGDGLGVGVEVNSEIPAMIAAYCGYELGAFTSIMDAIEGENS